MTVSAIGKASLHPPVGDVTDELQALPKPAEHCRCLGFEESQNIHLSYRMAKQSERGRKFVRKRLTFDIEVSRQVLRWMMY